MPVCMADVTRNLAQFEQGDSSTSFFALIKYPRKTQEGTKTRGLFRIFVLFCGYPLIQHQQSSVA
jgi:hypothetical protein